MALDLGGGHDIVDTGAEMSDFETIVDSLRPFGTLTMRRVIALIMERVLLIWRVSALILKIVMLDKLKTLWKNRAGEAAHSKYPGQKKRKRRNAHHSLGQLMEL